MALDPAALSDSLTRLFSGQPNHPASEAAAANALAEIYRTYAADATAGPTTPIAASLASAAARLSGALAAAFSAAKSSGAVGVPALASDMNGAFVGFWKGPPAVALASPPGPPNVTGIVTVAPLVVLAALFVQLFTTGVTDRLTADQQAEALATILDAWTRTVLVENAPPGPPAVPLT